MAVPSVGGGEVAMIGGVLAGLAVPLVVSLVLFAWGWWVAKRRGGRAWRAAAWMPMAALALGALGLCGSSFALIHAFGSLADVDPSQRSAVLAESISRAMNWTACAAIPAFALYLASVVTFAIGTMLRREPVSATDRR